MKQSCCRIRWIEGKMRLAKIGPTEFLPNEVGRVERSPPRMSYRTHVASSWPDPNSLPDGSTEQDVSAELKSDQYFKEAGHQSS